MARPQLSTRVNQDIFDQVVAMETNQQRNRSDVVQELIIKGLSTTGYTPPTPSITDAAKKMTADHIQLNQDLNAWKAEAVKWKKRAKKLEAGETVQETTSVSHPLVTKIETEGIILQNGEEEIKITSLGDLFEFINKLKD